MSDLLERVWGNLLGRLDGPLHLRFILQPTCASILAIRAALRDARDDKPAFFWSVLFHPHKRGELIKQGWDHLWKLLLIATVLDVVYQIVVHHRIYIIELLITVTLLGVVPYILLRGPIARLVKRLRPKVRQAV
jgi:hypothetical protein